MSCCVLRMGALKVLPKKTFASTQNYMDVILCCVRFGMKIMKSDWFHTET